MFDHGILNLPLSKRGSIDAEIDRYKSNRRRDEVARRAAGREDKARAQALLAEIGETIVTSYVGKIGTAKEIRKMLDQMVKWEPAKFLIVAEKFQAERATAI